MKDIEIKISRKTSCVDLPPRQAFAVDGENLQGNLIFSFNDEFVNGQARLELTIDGQDSWIPLLKEEETYYCPIKSAITKKGQIDMQLVITENENEDGIPIFKSNTFYLWCESSINAEIEQPEEYPTWIEIANEKLNEMDNLDIDATKVGDTATITITKKDGTEQSVDIKDGETGPQGKTGPAGQDAKINGVNTLNIVAGDNIEIEQEDNTMTISSTGGGGATYTAGTGIEITAENVINNTLPSKTITISIDYETMQFDKTADEINEYLNNGYIVMALGYQVFRKDYDASTHTIQLAIYFGAFGQVVTVTGNQLTNVNEYYYASDYNYVHTDNNFSYSYKNKLDTTAEVSQNNLGLVNGGQVYDAINWVVDISSLQVGDNITDSATINKLKDPRVIVKYNDTYFRFAKIYGSGYVYTVMNGFEGGEYITLNWTGSVFNLYQHGTAPWEVPSNKVTSLSSSSTDTQYPSAKCVYDALQNAGGGSTYLGLNTDFTQQNPLDLNSLDIGVYIINAVDSSNDNFTINLKATVNNNVLTKALTISKSSRGTANNVYILNVVKKIEDMTFPQSYTTNTFGYISYTNLRTSGSDNIIEYYNLYIEIGQNEIYAGSTTTNKTFNLVGISNTQTISGKKTFSTLPESSVVPTTDYQLVNKKYVDDNAGGGDIGYFVNIYPHYFSTLDTTDIQNIINKMLETNLNQAYLITQKSGYRSFNINCAGLSDTLSSSITSYVLNVWDFSFKNNPTTDGISHNKQAYNVTISWNGNVPTVTSTSKNGSMNTNTIFLNGNTTSWTPSTNYSPASKKYVDDSITSAITTTLSGSY